MLSYIGFAFCDVLTFPIAQREGGDFNEIRVDRISPDDCRSIRQGGAAAVLDTRTLKKRAFLAILATEEKQLTHSAALFAALRAEIARI